MVIMSATATVSVAHAPMVRPGVLRSFSQLASMSRKASLLGAQTYDHIDYSNIPESGT